MNLIFHIFIVIYITVSLTACDSGGSSSDASTATPITQIDSTTEDSQTDTSDTTKPKPGEQTNSASLQKSVSLSWNAPTLRTNGESLLAPEIGGFEVYYFKENTESGEGEVIQVPNPLAKEVTTPALTPGTYYFAIASYDINGVYSTISNYVTTTIE